jgi:D-arabinitol dehydrogenase (NADP+)
MKQVYLRQAYDLVTEEVPIPSPGEGAIVVKVEACGICATDVHSYEGETVQGNRYPFHPGHEIAGTVFKLGQGVSGLSIGDKVVADPLYPCETCDFCRVNKQNHCLSMRTLGIVGPGGFSDYTVIPAKNAYKFDNISFEEATLAEPLSTVVYGSKRAEVGLGDRVLINGAGAIGLLHLQVALHSGSAVVVVTDLNSRKLKVAKSLGASECILANDEKKEAKLKKLAPFGFDVIIDCTGIPKVIEQSLMDLKNSGRLVIFGVCPQGSEIKINPFVMYRRDLQIIGVYASNRTMGTAVDFLENKIVKAKELISEIIPRSQLKEILELLKQGKATGKVVVLPKD